MQGLPLVEGMEVAAWRRSVRSTLLAERTQLSVREHAVRNATLLAFAEEALRSIVPSGLHSCVGVYWPLAGEPDLRPLWAGWREQGITIALPVVLSRREPLLFREWNPETPMQASRFGIMEPQAGDTAQPDVLLVPTLWYDRANYRLGYGGGFYDRTLQPTTPRPTTVGVSFALGALETIYPQPWDVPLDRIVTENGC